MAAAHLIPPQLSVVFPCFPSCFVLLSEGEVCSSLISITVSSFPITPRPPQTACLLLKIKNGPVPVRTCPSSEAKEALRPPLNPLRTHSKLKDLHFESAPTPGPSDLSHSLSVLSVFHTLHYPPTPPHPSTPLFPLSSCQITSSKTGQWSLSARSQLCLRALNGRACLNVQWTLGVLPPPLSLSLSVRLMCMCVYVC